MIKELVRRGTNHKNFCEDSVYYLEYGNIVYLAVFDGCSTGIKSHFASELMYKIFRKSIVQFHSNYIMEYIGEYEKELNKLSSEEIMKKVFLIVLNNIKTIKENLVLQDTEFLSTLVLAVIKKEVKEKSFLENLSEMLTSENISDFVYDIHVLLSGDGAYYLNDKLQVVNSIDNKPDYIIYHLNDSVAQIWNTFKHFKHKVSELKNFSIMSDGITSFKIYDKSSGMNNILNAEQEKYVINHLLVDKNLITSDAMLSRKLNILEKSGYNHYDDLSIVRYFNEETK